jgi:hypothetical protein
MDRGSPARQLQFPPTPQSRRDGRPLFAAAGIVVLALAAIGVAWYYWTRVELQSRPASVPAVPLTSEMGATAEPTPAPVPAKPTSGAQTTRPVKAGERAEGRQADARPAASSRTAPSPPVAASRVVPAPSARGADSDDVLLIPVPKAGESPVFSAADEGVTPPVLMSPKLKTPLQQNEGAENLSTVDLVISDAGNVESVKLASPVRDYREAMMLSAVKAWRFKPASVEGLPVRYQLRIQISVTSVAAGNR